jgi:hypothetical protein
VGLFLLGDSCEFASFRKVMMRRILGLTVIKLVASQQFEVEECDGSSFVEGGVIDSSYGILWRKADEEVSGKFETEPIRGHTGCNLQKIWCDSFVESFEAFLSGNGTDCAPYRCIMISHS